MSDEAVPEVPDRRRAAALLSHRAHDDEKGVAFVIEEAAAEDRIPHLLAAVVDHGRVVFGALRPTPEGQAEPQAQIEAWAGQADPDYRRAASVLIARPHGRHDIVKQMVDEAVAEGRLKALVDTAARIFIIVLPELTTQEGRQQLAKMSATIAGWDDEPDDVSPESS